MVKSSESQNKLAVRRRTPLTLLPQPEFAQIERWCEISGMGRTATYQALAAEYLRGRKVGRRVLIDVPAGLAWLRSLPAAKVTLPNSRREIGKTYPEQIPRALPAPVSPAPKPRTRRVQHAGGPATP